MTAKKMLFLVMILCIVAQVQGATPTIRWQSHYGGSLGEGMAVGGLVKAADGNFLLAGDSDSGISGTKSAPNFGGQDFWLVKIDARNGNKLWDRAYGGSGYDSLMATLPINNGYLLGGYSYSGQSGNKLASNFGQADFWVVKTDLEGNRIWDKVHGGSDDDILTCMAPTPDGGFILGGYSVSLPSGDKSASVFGQEDFLFIKIDANGNKLWDRAYGGDNSDYATGVIVAPNGDLIFGGWSFSGISGNKTCGNHGGADFWVLRTDSEGNEIFWQDSYGGSAGDYMRCLKPTHDGNLLLGGWSFSGISGTKSAPNFGGQDFWLVKIDASNGNKLWDKSYGGSNIDQLLTIQETADHGLALGGWSFSGISGTKTNANLGNFGDFWLIKTDADGNELWQGAYGTPDDDTLDGIVETSDGGFILAGFSWGYDQSGDILVFRLNPTEPTMTATGCVGGHFTGEVSGPPGNYRIEGSTNLINWNTVVSSLPATNGVGSFTDPQSFSRRSYRAVKN